MGYPASTRLTGQVVMQSEKLPEPGANILEINISGLKEGPYFMKAQTTDPKSIIRKLTIIDNSR